MNKEFKGITRARVGLQNEGALRYVELLKTTLSLSFGGVLFLIGFEKDFVQPESKGSILVYMATVLLALSAILALASLWEWIKKPILQAQEAERQLNDLSESGELQENHQIVVENDVSVFEKVSYFGHWFTFFLAILLVIIFRAINI